VTDSWIPVRVIERWTTAREVVALRLAPEDGTLPDVEAGAHVDIEVATGLIRQYSLINPPGEAADYVIGIKLENPSRGGSRAIHERTRVGDRLRISRPRNNFSLEPKGDMALLIAGGIGVTPLLSMARALQAGRRPFTMHYFARSAEHVAFREILEAFGATCTLHLGLDPMGTATLLTSLLAHRQAGRHLYACGPGPMLDMALNIASDAGWPMQHVHSERFTAASGGAATEREAAFEVVLARQGRCVPVPVGVSIVEALRHHDIDIPTSCEQGICGTCETKVIEGRPDHRDSFLDDAQRMRGDCLLPCVSRAVTKRLVLDL
jgi:ferredoxin-NADP reductase